MEPHARMSQQDSVGARRQLRMMQQFLYGLKVIVQIRGISPSLASLTCSACLAFSMAGLERDLRALVRVKSSLIQYLSIKVNSPEDLITEHFCLVDKLMPNLRSFRSISGSRRC